MSLTTIGMKQGRDHVRAIMKYLGNPQDSLKVFHVTGSNGKWSVCQMISQVLYKEFDKKVGLFTSPHLVDVSERFQINGVNISHKKLNTLYKEVLDLSTKLGLPLSFFEIQVVAMVLYFVRKKVDYAVIEVGLGGLYDGTNIFHHPLACFVTSITFEHTHILGKTRSSILRNKLWITKPWTTLYTHIQNKQVKEYCEKQNVQLYESTKYKIQNTKKGNSRHQMMRLSDYPVHRERLTNLPWPHQQRNAQLVFGALTDLGFDEKKIIEGLQHIVHRGRYEWINKYILVDTANNRENIKILAHMLQEDRGQIAEGRQKWANFPLIRGNGNMRINIGGFFETGKLITIFGTTQTDPLYAAELANMLPWNEKILVDNFCDRALPCSTYAHFVPWSGIIDISQLKKKITAIHKKNPNTLILITGSLYLVWEIYKMSMH